MAYIKQTWVDQEGQMRYTETEDDGYKIFTPNFEEVTEIGTPVDALHMNHIEDGIAQCYTDFENMIKAIYPVGSIYIGMTTTCPLSSLFGTWTLITSGLTLQQADETNPVGTEIPAGLPSIAHTHRIRCASSGSGNGYVDMGSGSGSTLNTLGMNSGVSSIYGRSNTVQPPALAVNIWQRTA